MITWRNMAGVSNIWQMPYKYDKREKGHFAKIFKTHVRVRVQTSSVAKSINAAGIKRLSSLVGFGLDHRVAVNHTAVIVVGTHTEAFLRLAVEAHVVTINRAGVHRTFRLVAGL